MLYSKLTVCRPNDVSDIEISTRRRAVTHTTSFAILRARSCADDLMPRRLLVYFIAVDGHETVLSLYKYILPMCTIIYLACRLNNVSIILCYIIIIMYVCNGPN